MRPQGGRRSVTAGDPQGGRGAGIHRGSRQGAISAVGSGRPLRGALPDPVSFARSARDTPAPPPAPHHWAPRAGIPHGSDHSRTASRHRIGRSRPRPTRLLCRSRSGDARPEASAHRQKRTPAPCKPGFSNRVGPAPPRPVHFRPPADLCPRAFIGVGSPLRHTLSPSPKTSIFPPP